MRFYLFTFLFTLTFLPHSNSYSQDTIHLLNGKRLIAKSINEDTSSTYLKYDYAKKNKIKNDSVDKLEVFSFSYAGKTEKKLYRQDTAIGYKLSIPEMQYYILGEREAIKYYKVQWITLTGFAIGAAAVNYKGFWGLLSTIVFTTPIGLFNPKVKISGNSDPGLIRNNNFKDGYKSTATKKRVKNALLGTFFGIAAEVIISTIVNIKK